MYCTAPVTVVIFADVIAINSLLPLAFLVNYSFMLSRVSIHNHSCHRELNYNCCCHNQPFTTATVTPSDSTYRFIVTTITYFLWNYHSCCHCDHFTIQLSAAIDVLLLLSNRCHFPNTTVIISTAIPFMMAWLSLYYGNCHFQWIDPWYCHG